MHSKRKRQHGGLEGFGLDCNSKRFAVDENQHFCFPTIASPKAECERRDIAPVRPSGLLSSVQESTEQSLPHDNPEIPRKRKMSGKLTMRPPKVIRKAILVTVGPYGSSLPAYYDTPIRQDSAFDPDILGSSLHPQMRKEVPASIPGRLYPVSSSMDEVLAKVKYDVEQGSLLKIKRRQNEENRGAFLDDGTYGSECWVEEGNAFKDISDFIKAETRNMKVTHFDKFKPFRGVTPSVRQQKLKDWQKSSSAYPGQSKKLQSDLKCQMVSDENGYTAKDQFGGTGNGSARCVSIVKDVNSKIYSPEIRCSNMATASGVQLTDNQQFKRVSLFPQTGKIGGSKNQKYGNMGAVESKYNPLKETNTKASEHKCGEGKSLTKVESFGDSGKHSLALASKEPNGCQIKVRQALNLFKVALENIRKENRSKPKGQQRVGMRDYIDAAMLLKQQQKWVNVNVSFGDLPGIEVGDLFQSRAELVITGLHRKFIAGIDYKKKDGKLLATSIVASGFYPNESDSSDVLVYYGEGGNLAIEDQPEDQKLVRGNLALKNSRDDGLPVRVIRGCRTLKGSTPLDEIFLKESKFVYDGLYVVRDYWEDRGPRGNLIFKFRLVRMQEQAQVTWFNVNNRYKMKCAVPRSCVVVNDISEGKEDKPIRAVNDVDFGRPPPFEYIAKLIYPVLCDLPSGCQCINGCSDDIQCSCSNKNNEVKTETRRIFYECGPNCKCPPSCKNRRSQHGIQLQLEVFKCKSNEWGVRSRNYISAGNFVCEYIGELLHHRQEEERFASVHETQSHDTHQVVEDKSMANAHLRLTSFKYDVRFGNVGRFIKRSCSPNLVAKYVLFDHDDQTRQHLMLFSANTIPPLRELTYDYKF